MHEDLRNNKSNEYRTIKYYYCYYYDIMFSSVGCVNHIQLVPCHPNIILITCFPDPDDQIEYSQIKLLDVVNDEVVLELEAVGPTGIKDISRDGRVGIDGYLQVFDLTTGQMLIKLAGEQIQDNLEERPELFNLVCLTYDGKYAIWVDHLIMKVCRLADGRIIANTSTHEKPTSICSTDFGYFIVIGREDGHVIPLKLFDARATTESQLFSGTADDRLSNILNHSAVPDDVISTFEEKFQEKSDIISDMELPKIRRHLQKSLIEKSRVPHAIIHRKDSSRRRSSTLEVASEESPIPSPLMSPRQARCWSDAELGHSPRNSLHELFSPSRFIRSTSALFMSFAGSSENMSKDDAHTDDEYC